MESHIPPVKYGTSQFQRKVSVPTTRKAALSSIEPIYALLPAFEAVQGVLDRCVMDMSSILIDMDELYAERYGPTMYGLMGKTEWRTPDRVGLALLLSSLSRVKNVTEDFEMMQGAELHFIYDTVEHILNDAGSLRRHLPIDCLHIFEQLYNGLVNPITQQQLDLFLSRVTEVLEYMQESLHIAKRSVKILRYRSEMVLKQFSGFADEANSRLVALSVPSFKSVAPTEEQKCDSLKLAKLQ